ncbi:FimV/HubP family polar landmark protein [Rheinheimera sp.]|uniref:FimV/HubP family polar landmark protein n=1 Tax=Rheinheimera sp. TaxID=1869214 RepID=UPI00273652B7|nr:FimV/HubP family polar landmark protein [Rheinheimera sp.]MDP2714000.1 FimV/HubP family polar landmark protein [Rheinheimera sp.]
MPLLFVFIVAALVNFSSPVLAQEGTTQIRGPRSSDAPPPPLTIGPLSPSDTLWQVSERIKPEGNISLYQVMYAVYLKNPDAFIDGNLNRLRPGSTLTLPTEAEIQQVDLAIARRKSEQDDVIWAERQKAAAARRANTTVAAAKPDPQWQAELERIGRQQRDDLDGLRSQFADSMQLIESIADENLQLKTSLSRVQQELELIKAQLGEDSELQQQIELLLTQQAELLKARAEEEALKLQQQQSSNWQQWFKNPLAWILAACIPALLILFSILLWVKKRGRRTEDVIQAATTEKAVDPGYHSPLPPLDESNDLDESLFEIDDALLEDAFNDGNEFNDSTAVDDDMLQFDDGLSFEDDSLLPAVDDSLADDILSEPDLADITATKDDFDADNILSDTDLSALLAAEDDDDSIVELADDTLIADLSDEPGDGLNEAQAEVVTDSVDDDDMSAFDEVDIDELIEEIDFDAEDVLPDEDAQVAAEQRLAPATAATQQEQQLAESMAAVEESTPAQAYSFDSSELDEFAESLVNDGAGDAEQTAVDTDSDDDDAALLSAELTELLEQVEDSRPAVAPAEPEPEPEHQVAGQQDVEQLQENELQQDELLAQDMLLQDDEPNADTDIEDSTLAALDLTATEDDSVVRPGEAALSVENPSKILPEYPQLELTDDDLLSDLELLPADDEAVTDTATAAQDEIPEIELDPLPDAQFDSLMSELEAMADVIESDDAGAVQDDDAALLVDDLTAAQQDSGSDFNFAEDDFVEIDKLLADAGQQEQDTQRFDKLNVDVGLNDYAAIIGEHEQRDVDTEDNGYAAKLDLVRAYIEIDDRESADLLLDEILASDVPDNIKAEAQKLKQED